MGLKGNLAVVNLADVFQMLSRGKSTGLLRVQAPEGTRYIELQDGAISLAGRSTQYIELGDLLIARKAIDHAKLETALKIHRENGMAFGQVLLEMNYVDKASLEEALRFHIEEEVCDLFTLREGDFDFLANASLDTKNAPGGGAVRLKIDPDSLLLEAARRADEWNDIERRIVTQSLLFRLTEEGMRVYKDADGISDEGRVLMRLLQANHTVEGIVQKSCLGRLNANRMLLELWDAQLTEPVTKDEYLWFAKHQAEAGQLHEALRIAVQASKVGSPEVIKQTIPLIETLRKQLGTDDKTVPATGPAADKPAVPVKTPSKPNLLINKRRLPWVKIAAALLVIAGVAAGAYYYGSYDPRKEALVQFDVVKRKSGDLLHERRFFEASKTSDNFTPPAELKKEYEYFKNKVQTEIDTALIQDVGDFFKKTQFEVSRADLAEIKKKMADFDGVKIVSPIAVSEQAKMSKKIPAMEETIRVAEFKARFDQLHSDMENRMRGTTDIITGLRELLADRPPEDVAAHVRKDLYNLSLPRAETRRQLDLAAELLAKGGYESARKIAENVKNQNPGSDFAADADKILHDIDERQTRATQDLAKVRKLVLQRKVEEARAEASLLIKSLPPAGVLDETLKEVRKLLPDSSETEIQQLAVRAAQLWDSDPKRARYEIANLIANYPYSETAWSATMRVSVESSPPGAAVVLYTGAGERPLGRTPLMTDLPALGTFRLAFSMPNFEPLELVLNNFHEEKIQAVFVRKPQAAALVPVAATAGMLLLNDRLMLAGGSELVVCSGRSLEVQGRIDLEGAPLPMKIQNKTTQLPPLSKGELKLKALSASAEDAEVFALVSCSGPYFFQIPSNTVGTEFFRIACEPAAVGAPMMYRPKRANATKLIGLISRFGFEVFGDGYRPVPGAKKPIPPEGSAMEPDQFAFDGDTFYVPRDNNVLYAVEGYRGDTKFEVACANRISLPPAVIKNKDLLGIIDVRGVVTIIDTQTRSKDREKARVQLDAPSTLGLAASADSFIAALDDNTLAAIPATGGKASWTVTLPGKPVMTPLVAFGSGARSGKDSSGTVIVCSALSNNSYSLTAYRADSGVLLWQARLGAKPVNMTCGPDAVFISTAEAELLRFDLVIQSQP